MLHLGAGALVVGACTATGAAGDGGLLGHDDAADAADGDPDESGDRVVPGPLTQVVSDVEVIEDRLCDIDGDGVLDSSIGDLGPVQSEMFRVALNAVVIDQEEADNRLIVHFPHVDDVQRLDDPQATLIVCQARDADDPPDRSDDFSGEESFNIRAVSLDACGEPLHYFPNTILSGGQVQTTLSRAISLPLGADYLLTVQGAQATATIADGGASGLWRACGSMPIRDLGGHSPPTMDAGDLSFLEILLAGGAALGVALLPGLAPDLDLDGDGIERFVLDEGNRIEQCIDGDMTPIVGRDCWTDPRIADAFSLNVSLEAVPARIAGLEPGWEENVAGTCEAPPERSLWDSP